MAALRYTAPFSLPDFIQRGVLAILTCPVYRAGQLAVPTAGTVVITDGAGTVIYSGAVTGITDGVATYNLAALTTSGLALGDGWLIVWTLTMPDGQPATFRNAAALVRCVPSPAVSEQTIFSRLPALDPTHPAAISKQTDYTREIGEAWVQFSARLAQHANRIELLINPTQHREPHLLLTLAAIMDNLSLFTPQYATKAAEYREQYHAAMASMSFDVDADDDGKKDAVKPARLPIFLM